MQQQNLQLPLLEEFFEDGFVMAVRLAVAFC
jgi:hypothetical protein